jgi:nitrogen-specific signal transduction histidine kinase
MHDVTEITKSLVSRKVALVNDVRKDMPIITADADRLVQIMYNLIGNAGKVVLATQKKHAMTSRILDEI